MATDAPPSLPDDVQRALQQAVGDVNDIVVSHKKKSSKRAREDDRACAPDADEPATKKKKSKSHTSPTDAGSVDSPVITADTIPAAVEVEKKKKKKKKGKEKATEPETLQDAQLPPSSEPAVEIQPSTADFLSAVVAAASATSGATDQQHVPPHPPFDQPPPFMEYQHDFAPFPYPPQPHAEPFPTPHPGQMFPDSGLDLNFTSNEEFLRLLQESDLSKVMSVFRSLGEAASAANVSVTGQPTFMPHSPSNPPALNQQPVRSDAILGRPPKQHKSTQSNNTPPNPQLAPVNSPPPPRPLEQECVGNPDHAHMLANVWMNASKLADLVKKEGLIYKKGKFSKQEEAQLHAAIEHYRVTKGLTQEQMTDIIFSKEKGRDSFWPEITSALPLRPIIAVYHHVRRTRHPLHQQGKWMPTEDDLLIQAVAEFGGQWEKVSRAVGRMSGDCRDRWRNHLQDRGTRNSGAWTKKEEEELTRIVSEMTLEKGKGIDSDIFWGIVSERMGGKRGRQQCRIKWTDTISTQIKNSGERPRWSQLDAYILVHKVDSLNVHDDSEIDWKALPDEHWNIWSAHSLQRRWLTMKRGIKGHEEMSHAEIMEILKTKKAQALPPPATSNRKRKGKPTSAEAVVEADDGEERGPQAGPSRTVY